MGQVGLSLSFRVDLFEEYADTDMVPQSDAPEISTVLAMAGNCTSLEQMVHVAEP